MSTAELLYQHAEHIGLQPAWIIPGGLFAVSIDGREKYINFARSPLNSDTSVSLAKDKYLTRLILERNGVPNIPFEHPATMAAAEEFLALHADIIAKPLNGSGSRDIHRVVATDQLHDLRIEDYILEKYIAGSEVRYLVLNGAVIGVYESSYGTSVAVDRPREGFTYSTNTWDEALVESSLRIAEIMDLNFAAVDYLIEGNNQPHVLEVNTTPDLKWFHSPSSGPVVDIASLFMESFVAHNLSFGSQHLIMESR